MKIRQWKNIGMRVLAGLLCLVLVLPAFSVPALADSARIVTLGADLSPEQREMMFSYFNTDAARSMVITITNAQEHQYLDGIATREQIGSRTFSCCYIEPTNEGGINVKCANLTWVSEEMIRNALVTSGIVNCNVVAAAPFEVSGTGALTGIFVAYEQSAQLEDLEPEKVETATEELIATATVAEEVGQEEAAKMIETLKETVIEEKSRGINIDFEALVDEYVLDKGLKLTPEHRELIIGLVKKYSDLNYDIDQIELAVGKIKTTYNDVMDTIDTIDRTAKKTKGFLERVGDFFAGIWRSIAGLFGGKKEEPVSADDIQEALDGVIREVEIFRTNDAALGLTEEAEEETEEEKPAEGEPVPAP